jgi:hypothetical protein
MSQIRARRFAAAFIVSPVVAILRRGKTQGVAPPTKRLDGGKRRKVSFVLRGEAVHGGVPENTPPLQTPQRWGTQPRHKEGSERPTFACAGRTWGTQRQRLLRRNGRAATGR